MGWFVRFDRAFREYFAMVRATLLSKKNVCCTEWTADFNERALNVTNEDEWETDGHGYCSGQRWDNRTGSVDNDGAYAGVGYCMLQKVYRDAKHKCNAEKFPKSKRIPTGKLKPPVRQDATAGWVDNTTFWLKQMTATCAKHIYIPRGSTDFQSYRGYWSWMCDTYGNVTGKVNNKCHQNPREHGAIPKVGDTPDGMRSIFELYIKHPS